MKVTRISPSRRAMYLARHAMFVIGLVAIGLAPVAAPSATASLVLARSVVSAAVEENALLHRVAGRPPPKAGVRGKAHDRRHSRAAKPAARSPDRTGIRTAPRTREAATGKAGSERPVRPPLSSGQKHDARERLARLREGRHFDFASIGPLKRPAKPPGHKDEVIRLRAGDGLQSRKAGMFSGTKIGDRASFKNTYLWTIDDRGINIALEHTEIGSSTQIRHTNLSSMASIGGEAWFQSGNTVVINAASGRFGYKAGTTERQWKAAIRAWQELGYKVEPRPLGER